MKHSVERFECQSTIVTNAVLECINLEPNLWVYSKTVTGEKPKTIGTFRNVSAINDHAEQGFVDDKNLEKLKKGGNYKPLGFSVVGVDVQEKVRLHGWHVLYEIFENHNFDKPFDDIAQANYDLNSVIRFDTASHMIYDRNGEVMPVGVRFDYMSGHITDGRFDMVKLANHLLKRKDVVVHSTEGWRNNMLKVEPATTVEDAVSDVPYYNRDPGCLKTIYFTWQPTKALYKKMWDKCLTLDKKYPATSMHQAIFELDLLGMRKCGAAYFDNYYETRRDIDHEYE